LRQIDPRCTCVGQAASKTGILQTDQRKDAGKMGAGQAKPNPQAAALVLLVRRYPDTLERLEKVAAG
jgi:hypothetical protein